MNTLTAVVLAAAGLTIAGAGPSQAATPAFQTAFEANSDYLYTWNTNGATNTLEGMKAGTSPSIAALSTGGYEIAFQANTGYLYVDGPGGLINTTEGMMAGTNPSIAASPSGGYKVAFQANTGNLFTWSPSTGAVNTTEGMRASTSPSITAIDGGYEEAFQSNTGYLYLTGINDPDIFPHGVYNTGTAMSAATSPSLAYAYGFQVMFQSSAGYLCIWDEATSCTGELMASDSSPDITPVGIGNGYVGAFQNSNGDLAFYDFEGDITNTTWQMKFNTSPSVTYDAGGTYDVAYQASSSNLNLYTWPAGGSSNIGLGMAGYTSPAIAG